MFVWGFADNNQVFAYGDLGLINGNQCTDWSVTDVQVKVAKA